jgi:heme A synthase
MSLPFAEIVESKALFQTVVYSLLAGVGLTFAFSVALYGATRTVELRRNDRALAAAAMAGLMALGFAVCVAALVLGFIVMTSK